ncbi:MAG: hypothetical protein MJ252_06380 [archaeon]|nr:hypothetical protein [archaeon]
MKEASSREREALDKRNHDNKISKNIKIEENKIHISSSITIFTFNQAYDSIWEIISDATKVNTILAKVFPLITKPIQITKVPPGHVFNKFVLIFNGTIKIYFNMLKLIETDYFSSIIWEISQNEKALDGGGIINDSTKAKIVVNIHKAAYKQTYFTFVCSNIVLNKIDNSGIKRRNEEIKINYYFTLLDQTITKYNKIQTQREVRLIVSDFKLALEFFLNTKICIGMAGTIISFSNEKFQKGTTIKYKNSKNIECLIQVIKCSFGDKQYYSKLYISEGNDITTGKVSREIKVEMYSVNHEETYVVITHYFGVRVPKEEIEYISTLKRNLLNKLSHYIEKTWRKQKTASL